MPKKKYYAVKTGHKTGVFDTWEECQENISGYSGAVYKSFSTEMEAHNFINGRLLSQSSVKFVEELPAENEIFAYVDGSFDVKSNKYGYGVVLIFHDGNIEKLNGAGENEVAVSMRNVAGELKGAIIAMQYAVNNKYGRLTVYHDYEGIGKWARKEWKANLDATKAYMEFCDKVRARIDLKFVKVDAHSGVVYNELADELAKSALGLV